MLWSPFLKYSIHGIVFQNLIQIKYTSMSFVKILGLYATSVTGNIQISSSDYRYSYDILR